MRRDFSAPTFPIYANSNGRVVFVEDGTVGIEYEDGRTARYFHVHDVEVAEGDRVVTGQRIGRGHA